MFYAVDWQTKNYGKPAEPEQEEEEAATNQISHHWKWKNATQTGELKQQVRRQTAQFYLQLL